MFFKKNNQPQYQGNIVKNLNAEFIELDKWELSSFILNKIIPIIGIKPYPLDELLFLVSIICKYNPTFIFEWGTHLGKSTRIFHETIKYFNLKTEIHSFDLPDEINHIEHPGNQRGIYVKGCKNVFLYQEDGLARSIKIYNESTIPNKSVIYYLDGDHSLDTVLNELTTINNNIYNSVIILHDTFFQSNESGYNTGPHDAINIFLESNNIKFKRIDTNFGLPGMSVLIPIIL
jgi:cephalosporin hydroxylase